MAKGGKLTKLKSVLKKWNSMGRIGRTNSTISDSTPDPLHPVYVGKSRRQYLVGSDVIDHPLFRELVDRSGESAVVAVDCEVVLFEHLLWMIENGDPDSVDELAEFYAC